MIDHDSPLSSGMQPLADAQYRMLFMNMTEGFALHEIITDDHNTPINYRFLAINDAFEKQSGIPSHDLIGRTVLDVLPNLDVSWIQNYGNVAIHGMPLRVERFDESTKRWYDIYAYQPAPRQFAVLFRDMTDRKNEELKIKERNDELELWQKTSVDRELKMIELKKTIDDMQEQIKQLKNSH
jgi:PAS domain-containing protein